MRVLSRMCVSSAAMVACVHSDALLVVYWSNVHVLGPGDVEVVRVSCGLVRKLACGKVRKIALSCLDYNLN